MCPSQIECNPEQPFSKDTHGAAFLKSQNIRNKFARDVVVKEVFHKRWKKRKRVAEEVHNAKYRQLMGEMTGGGRAFKSSCGGLGAGPWLEYPEGESHIMRQTKAKELAQTCRCKSKWVTCVGGRGRGKLVARRGAYATQ